jgi:hypothetical protein
MLFLAILLDKKYKVMSKHCRGCNREISWGSYACPFCGAGSNPIRYYLPHLGVLAVVVATATGLSRVYIEHTAETIQQQAETEWKAQLKSVQETNQSLKQQLTQLKNELAIAQQEVEQLKSQQADSIGDAEARNTALKQQLSELQQEAERQKGRANWLGKENTRLKSELEQLKQQLVELQQSTSRQTGSAMFKVPETDSDASNQPPEKSDEDGNN